MINASWEEELYKYITGIIQNKDQKLLAINGSYDHIHILIGMKPNCLISDLVKEIKKSSSGFINIRRFSKFHFNWQEGYGAFSYSHKDLNAIIGYIQNQKEHHKKRKFRDEYLELLKDFEIEMGRKVIFEWLD